MINNYINKQKMKKNLIRLTTLLLSSLLLISSSFAQPPATLEWVLESSSLTTFGPSTNPIPVTFLKDATNANAGTTFTTYVPTLIANVSIRNQQRSSTLTGTSTVLPGLTFGGRNTNSQSGNPGIQAVGSSAVYDVFAAGIPSQLPKNSMYMSSPSATPAPPTDILGNGNPPGRGFDTEFITAAMGPNGDDANGGIGIYSCVDALHKANELKDGRFYFGDLVITFNRPVKNPVIHVGGLGGSYNYEVSTNVRKISYFTTELELQNTGMNSVFMAGNPNLNLVGNNILNGAAKPNAGSYDDGSATGGFLDYGAASGSIKLVGTIQEIVYRIYVRGSSASDFNFSKTKGEVPSFNRDPLNGDFWYLSVSLDKPSQEISGTVFIDPDGLTDNNINKAAGVDNTPTNVAELLYALLLNPAGRVVESTPVSSDGRYLFSNVPLLAAGSNYTVQLVASTIPGVNPIIGASYASPQTAPPPSLPMGWVNTGEFVSSTTTVGSDGLVNGRIVVPFLVSEDAKVLNNFGIEREPQSLDISKLIKIPTNGTILTLSGLSTDSLGAPMPALAGSDPEDQPSTLPLGGKTVKITTLPFSTGATATLLYAGTPVVLNQIIPNYDPNLLQLRFNTITFAPGIFQGSTTFNYAYVDAAGVVDPTPASYTVFWQKPVDFYLESFTATKSNCVATLNWKTSAEINSDKFEIEMSTLTNARFMKIGSVKAKGNSTSVTNYQLMFPMESGVVYQFRLKMIDIDGTFAYSDIKIVSCIDKQEIGIKPNPTVDIFNITNMEKGKNVVSILSADSKLMQVLNFTNTSAEISLVAYAKGVYIIKIQNENGSIEVRRIVKN